MKKKLQKVIGVLSIMKDFNMKPNFSELERMYGIDRHTIKKYYENGGIPERKKFKRVSKWDPLFDVIISLADVPGSYLMSKSRSRRFHSVWTPFDIPFLRNTEIGKKQQFWAGPPVNRLVPKII